MSWQIVSNMFGAWIFIWPLTGASGRRWPLQRLIRLDAAAQIARNRMLNPGIGRMVERMMHELEDGPLTYYARTMANSDDVTVYGYRRDATRREPIDKAELARGRIAERGAALLLPGSDEPAYTGLRISRADMRRKVRALLARTG